MELKKYRIIKNITQQRVADELGISRQYVSDIERGYKEPSKELIKKIIIWSGGSIKLQDLWNFKTDTLELLK